MATRVLVLNQNYEPLNVCDVHRAFVLVNLLAKAEVVECNGHTIRTSSAAYPAPTVIRLLHLIKRAHPVAKLTRREVFMRDKWRCQYCGLESRDLTLDHVIPRHRGGQHRWDNLVTACKNCNHRKGGRLPDEARMRLMTKPAQPRVSPYYWVYQHLQSDQDPAWLKFIPNVERYIQLPSA